MNWTKEEFGGEIPVGDRMRFWRLIEEHERIDDGTEEALLACGHRVKMKLQPVQRYGHCPVCEDMSQCLHERLDEDGMCRACGDDRRRGS
jgi:hypothetical protein